MEFFAVILVVFLGVVAWSELRRKMTKLPPGPYPLPIVGNILQMAGGNPHHTFAHLAKKYGPLFSLRLGSVSIVVVSSPEMAKEVLTRQEFACRQVVQAAEPHGVGDFSMAFLPSDDKRWKDMRKVCAENMFAYKSLEESQGLRHQKLQQLLDHVQSRCDAGGAVNIQEAAWTTTINLLSAILLSSDATEFDSGDNCEIKEIIKGISHVTGKPNYADYFPILKPLDLQGVRRQSELHVGRMLRLINVHLDQRLESRKTNPNRPKPNDTLETLLDSGFSLDAIPHIIKDMFVAGIEAMSIVLEWTLTELLLHPDVFDKVKEEVRSVGGGRKIIPEAETARLPYLQAVIKEVFRLHPPAPLLVPRKAAEDTEINGYFIPKDTQLIVNAWGIARDPSLWSHPESFDPQRFLNKEIDFKGQYFELVPFGSGRRICPAMPLVNRVSHAVAAALILNFDWEFAAGQSERNMQVLCGFTLSREFPLIAIPSKPNN